MAPALLEELLHRRIHAVRYASLRAALRDRRQAGIEPDVELTKRDSAALELGRDRGFGEETESEVGQRHGPVPTSIGFRDCGC